MASRSHRLSRSNSARNDQPKAEVKFSGYLREVVLLTFRGKVETETRQSLKLRQSGGDYEEIDCTSHVGAPRLSCPKLVLDDAVPPLKSFKRR